MTAKTSRLLVKKRRRARPAAALDFQRPSAESRAQRRGVLGRDVCEIGGIRQLEADLARGRLEADGAAMAGPSGRDASY